MPPLLAPKFIDLVTDISVTVNPPEPVHEKLVIVPIFKTVIAGVVPVPTLIFPVLALPNAIERVVLTAFELNIPVDNVTASANINAPAANVYVPVAVNA